jgi:glycosyltransferase involved in cell wall biosynthesis
VRILVLCGDHGIPAFGRKGASTHLREIIAALRRAGAEVALAAVDLGGDRRPDEDFQTFHLPAPKSKMLGIDGRYLVADRRASRVLAEAVTRFRPDAVYERSALYFGAGQRLAAARGLPRLLEVNTLLSEELSTRLKFPRWAASVERGLITRADGIAAISSVLRERLVSEFAVPAERVDVYTMAVDPRRFRPTGARAQRRRELGIPDDMPLLGFVGSMNHYHKPRWFFELLETLAGEGARCAALVIGGADSKNAMYRERARGLEGRLPVVFKGTLPQAELTGWMEAMDLVVVPGAAPQSTPTKIFEVAAVGTPLLLPATVPIRSIVPAEAGALLFDPEDAGDLGARVRAFLADPAPLRAAADALRARVLAHYTWDSHAARLLEWYARLARRG